VGHPRSFVRESKTGNPGPPDLGSLLSAREPGAAAVLISHVKLTAYGWPSNGSDDFT
jgi:hypothetical protein